MITLQEFANAYDIAEQLNCWPGEVYEGDAVPWDAWLRTGTDPDPDELAMIDAILRRLPAARVPIHRGGYGPDGSRVLVGEKDGYAFFACTTQSTSCDVAILQWPDGHVVWRDTLHKSGAFSAEAWTAMPDIPYTLVQQADEAAAE